MIFKDPKIKSSDITPKNIYENRRHFLKTATVGLVAAGLSSLGQKDVLAKTESSPKKLPAKFNKQYSVNDKKTSYKDITTYNNFYEFGMDKDDPARYAKTLNIRPWTISVE